MEQKPSIGRIVHFGFVPELHGDVATPTRCAAIITEVIDDTHVRLQVFHPAGYAALNKVWEYSPELKMDCWSWPPRVP